MNHDLKYSRTILVMKIIDMTYLYVLFLACDNLQAGAVKAGITPLLTWAWPVCVDALLIAGSLMILRSDLNLSGTVPSPVPVPPVQNDTIPDVTLVEQKRK